MRKASHESAIDEAIRGDHAHHPLDLVGRDWIAAQPQARTSRARGWTSRSSSSPRICRQTSKRKILMPPAVEPSPPPTNMERDHDELRARRERPTSSMLEKPAVVWAETAVDAEIRERDGSAGGEPLNPGERGDAQRAQHRQAAQLRIRQDVPRVPVERAVVERERHGPGEAERQDGHANRGPERRPGCRRGSRSHRSRPKQTRGAMASKTPTPSATRAPTPSSVSAR